MIKYAHIFFLATAFLLPLCPSPSSAQPPALINYQGRLVDGTNLVNGSVDLTLRLFNAPSGGTLLYSDWNSVTVVDGLYATYIGDNTIFGDLDTALTNAQVWLEAVVNGIILTPRERIVSAPYARQLHGFARDNAGNTLVNALGTNAIRRPGEFSVIGGGSANLVDTNASFSTIAGGAANVINRRALGSVIAGGVAGWIGASASNSVIGGGLFNFLEAQFGVIGGGFNNNVQSPLSVIGGGSGNQIGANSSGSLIVGGSNNVIGAFSDYAVIGGGVTNKVHQGSDFATIGGGYNNQLFTSNRSATISGGSNNRIGENAHNATIGGGYYNRIAINAEAATIGGGWLNEILTNAVFATISGGHANMVEEYAFYAAIPGGRGNTVGAFATNAFAAGFRAVANHPGSFVWSDLSSSFHTVSTNANSVTFRAAGGYRFFSNGGMSLGARLNPNATAWSVLSDRAAKENFEPIDSARILERVRELPLSSWSYKDDPGHRRYIGPVAQDFHAAFGLGDDITINSLDTDGVLYAAVQALAKENAEFRMQNAEIRRENEELKSELEAIKRHLGLNLKNIER